jgi:hypothetical protein
MATASKSPHIPIPSAQVVGLFSNKSSNEPMAISGSGRRAIRRHSLQLQVIAPLPSVSSPLCLVHPATASEHLDEQSSCRRWHLRPTHEATMT